MPRKAVYAGKKGWDRLEHQVRVLVPAEKKRWIWKAVALKSLALNRARIRAQENLDGSRFAPRADGGKKRMMTKILKGNPLGGGRSQTKIRLSSDGMVLIHPWKTAAEHHFGATRTVNAMTHEELLKRQRELRDYNRSYEHGARKGNAPKFGAGAMAKGYGGESQQDSPCTKEQARTLKKVVGFKKLSFDGGKSKVTATLANLQKAFTMAEAGYIIRKHRIARGDRPKSHWTVTLPSRHVLGLSEADERILMHYMSTLIAKYSYFSFTMQQGEYAGWASKFVEENMMNAA